jgi:cephalosporin-C deacetylase-like acetyl esterase
MNPYNYTPRHDGFNLQLKEATAKWSHYAVDFPTAHPNGFAGSKTVLGDYFCPQNASKVPLVILVHGMGDRSVMPCKLLARTLVKRGMACFILYLVFHERRMPEAIKEHFPKMTANEWFESYEISVTDIRQVVDLASTRQEIKAEKVSVIGISFGGFVSAIAMGLDQRIKAGVFVVSAGNSEKMTRNSLILKKQYKYNEAEYHQNQTRYEQYLAEVAEKGFENVTPAKKSYLTDPMTFACYLRNRPLLMVNALWDEMIPREAALDMWQACGKPPIMWFPATHASIWMWYPVIGWKIARFLKSNLQLSR